ncbi:hypothetical protein NC652_022590 [Populus alba x Populus x berolinensis]|uniref:Uncharacterized protein n=1 Tax=Populus alba x Populus x berolinensis TaxID=444605 RepID=A0AAD6Q9E9_9ROSI|nr:hypothetical protein NC652_022590 [Populus alba x Populus x berolinensis]KAJ6984122.1 hypothetical protein NC653_022380 [Populus alba x Populus x berolinensis]KAJ6984129.1 hypothetical protein NC653_022387 [Populus alba x Populus x berolinensis]
MNCKLVIMQFMERNLLHCGMMRRYLTTPRLIQFLKKKIYRITNQVLWLMFKW